MKDFLNQIHRADCRNQVNIFDSNNFYEINPLLIRKLNFYFSPLSNINHGKLQLFHLN